MWRHPAAIEELNHYLHEAGEYIIGRMGIPYREKGINIISIAIDAPQDMISAFVREDRASEWGIHKNGVLERHYESGGKSGMKKIAVYGKGGIGKSTTVSNVAVALARKGTTRSCRSAVIRRRIRPSSSDTERRFRPYWNCIQQKKQTSKTGRYGYALAMHGVVCVEAGGPTPGLGCAGRGIITALEKLKETGAYEYLPAGCRVI